MIDLKAMRDRMVPGIIARDGRAVIGQDGVRYVLKEKDRKLFRGGTRVGFIPRKTKFDKFHRALDVFSEETFKKVMASR